LLLGYGSVRLNDVLASIVESGWLEGNAPVSWNMRLPRGVQRSSVFETKWFAMPGNCRIRIVVRLFAAAVLLSARGGLAQPHTEEVGRRDAAVDVPQRHGLPEGDTAESAAIAADLPPFSRDGRYCVLVGGSSQNLVRVWDVRSNRITVRIRIPNGGVYRAMFSPDSRWIATSGFQGLHLFDRETGNEIRKFTQADQFVADVAFSADSKTLLALDAQRVRQFDVESGGLRRTIPIPEALDEIGSMPSMSLSSCGNYVAISSGDFTSIYRLSDGAVVRQIIQPNAQVQPRASVLSGNGALFATIANDNTVTVLESRSGAMLFQAADETVAVSDLVFSPDSRLIAGPAGDSIVVWDALTGTEIVHFGLANERGDDFLAESIAFSDDSRYLLAAIHDPERSLPWRRIWDLAPYRPANLAAQIEPLSEEQIESRWRLLGDRDAARAYKSIRKWLEAPRGTVEFLSQKLQEPLPRMVVKDHDLAELLKLLEDPSFDARERASSWLRRAGVAGQRTLEQALGRRLSLESRLRVQRLLDEILDSQRVDEFRRARAVLILEWLGTDAARASLEAAANQTDDRMLRRDASAALVRWDAAASRRALSNRLLLDNQPTHTDAKESPTTPGNLAKPRSDNAQSLAPP